MPPKKTKKQEASDDAQEEPVLLEPIDENTPKIEMKPVENWKPKTNLGKKVQNKEITDIDEILDNGTTLLEQEIVDSLIASESELLMIGQAKGKFGRSKKNI